MRMVNISNEKSMQSYTARCSRYKNKYTNLVCGKTAVGRNYNLPRDILKNMIVVCPNHHKMLHYHFGGYKQIIKEDNQLFFSNGKGEKIQIIDNYHLEETHSK